MDPDGRIDIGVALNPGDPCTDDLAQMTHSFTFPETAQTHPTTVLITGPREREDVVICLD